MSKRSTQADQGAGSAEGKRTEVFISATSGDLSTVREMVKQGLLTMGCFPIEQTNFEPDYRTVRQMLETRIAQCDAVIHLVGVRYGAEPDPASVPEGQTRRSYTQMEAEIARKLGKKLYVFLCPEDFSYDEGSPAESDEKRELQQTYRQQVAKRESLHTPVRSREDIALKVRELKFELKKLKRAIAHDRTRTFAVLAGLLIALAAISTGVWWWVAHGPQTTAEKVAGQFRYDRSRMREQLATEIRAQAQKRIASLNQTEDWRKINEIEKERDQQLADLDRLLDGIERTSKEGEASESYLTASKLLQEKGVGEALAFLEAKSSQRAELIEAQKKRRDREENELRKLLQEELLAASLLEKQLRFKEAEHKYRKVVGDAGLWAEPRNAFAWFLIQRGITVEPAKGNVKLNEAAEICQETLTLNQRGKSPQDWPITQNNLGVALYELGTRSGGEEGRRLLENAVAAFRSALEVFTKADLPQSWATAQNNLGGALLELGRRSGGEEGRKLLEGAVAAFRSALEVFTKADLPQPWAMTQYNLGLALYQLGTRSGEEEGRKLLEDAVVAFRSALEVFTKADLSQYRAKTQNNLSDALGTLGNQLEGEEGLKRKRESVELLREVVSYQPGDQSRYWLASTLGDLAFKLVLNSQFAEAKTRCEEAQKLANEIGDEVGKTDRDDLIFIKQNLAHALFFQGHYDEALAIYRQNWDKPLAGKTFGEITLEDFAAFDNAGLTHPDLSRMKRALADLRSKAPSP